MPKIPPIKKSSVVVRTKKSMVRVKDGMVIVSTIFNVFSRHFKRFPAEKRIICNEKRLNLVKIPKTSIFS